MKQRHLGTALSLLLLATSLTALGSRSPRAPARAEPAQVAERLGGLAVPFVENAGQSDPRVAYYAPTFSGTVFVTRQGEIVYALPGSRRVGTRGRAPTAPAAGWTLTESFVDGRAAPVAAQPAATQVSFFLANDRARWRSQVATYADVDLGAVWPGIGVTLKAYGKQVEKVFTVEPGAAPETIRVRVAGAQGLAVAADGGLAVHTGVGDVRLTPPVAYQEVAGTRRMLDAAYTVAGDAYGFQLAGYDPSRPVVIDPLLQATYLGGSDHDAARAVAIGPTTGEVYVAGITTSTDFPGTSGGAQSSFGGDGDAFVARLNASLTGLDQTTYLGGSSFDQVFALAIAPTTGEVYVAGSTSSTDFPGTSGGAQTVCGGPCEPFGSGDAFVARLNASLTALDQATYLGGNGYDDAYALALGPTGEVYVAGTTGGNFPGTSGGAQDAPGGGYDVYAARLNATLTALDQATYLGGSDNEAVPALATGPTGEVYVAGRTISNDFPGTSGGAQSANGSCTYVCSDSCLCCFWACAYDAFVARLNASLTALDQATYLGGGDNDLAFALAIAPTAEVYVAGSTSSTDFPGTSGGAQSALLGDADAFVARLDGSLTALVQATYLGGSSGDGDAQGLVIAPTTGDVYVAGITGSIDFPGTNGGAQSTFGGYSDTFVARMNASLTALDQATYLGGSDEDEPPVLAITPIMGEVYVAGSTRSTDFPGTSGGAQNIFGGGYRDAFVARLSADLAASGGAHECAAGCGRQKKICICTARTTNLACKLECRTDAGPRELGACMRGCTATFRAVQHKCRSDHRACLGTCQPHARD